MSNLLYETQDQIGLITINREQKRNAFDSYLLSELDARIEQAKKDPSVRVIILKANGSHFSAGGDVEWMKSMAGFNEEENLKDALILGRLMYNLYHCPKPTIALPHGCSFGGGAGLVAACSIGIAANTAQFCFPEVKLGLIPAVISPYVVQAIGERSAQALFMSAEVFDALRALSLHLIHHCVPQNELLDFGINYAQQIIKNAPKAVEQSLQLVRHVVNKPINEELMQYTSALIADKRISREGQKGLVAFLSKKIPNWNKEE